MSDKRISRDTERPSLVLRVVFALFGPLWKLNAARPLNEWIPRR